MYWTLEDSGVMVRVVGVRDWANPSLFLEGPYMSRDVLSSPRGCF